MKLPLKSVIVAITTAAITGISMLAPVSMANAGTSLPVLHEGSTGSAVVTLQRDLGHLATDGIFGASTEKAVVNYQTSHHLHVDGVVGSETWGSLTHSGSITPVVAPATKQPMLKLGSHGSAVKTLQHDLKISVTGTFDSKTRTAVLNYQANHGLVDDGVVGAYTWNSLAGKAAAQPSGVDARALAAAKSGWAIDISKDADRLTVLHLDRKTHQVTVYISTASSHGGTIKGVHYDTTNGVWHVFRKEGPNYVAHTTGDWNGAHMAWAVFFNGGQAIHGDPLNASHGCVHVDVALAKKINQTVPMGTPVVVHN